MSLLSAARRGVWKCRWLAAGVCAAAAMLPTASHAQQSDGVKQAYISPDAPIETLPAFRLTAQKEGQPTDPVESLRQGLQIEPGKDLELAAKRKKTIETAIDELKTVAQLRRAYFLNEWRHEIDPEKDKESDSQRFRKPIGAALTRAISQSAQGPDPEKMISAAMWIADVAGNVQVEVRDLAKDQFARGLTSIVLQLLKQEDVTVRQAALHALGRITPSPAEVFPVLKNTLEKDTLGPRRLAAYAMTDLVKNVKGHDRAEQLEVMHKTVSTASLGLRDADESVRGYSLLAILDTAKAFFEYVSDPPEKKTVEARDKQIEGKDKQPLTPDMLKVMKSFQTAMPQLLQALVDPKVKVRLAALQTVGHVSEARLRIVQKLRDLDKGVADKNETPRQLLKAYAVPDPFGDIGENDWNLVARLLRDDDERVRRGTLEFLEGLGEQAEPALPAITAALRDPNLFVRWTAARTLRNVPAKKVSYDAVRALAFLLMDADPDVSKAAAATLEALGPQAVDAVPELGHMIANVDPANRAWDPENRLAAMKALSAIGPERTLSVIPKLIIALADQDPRIRRQAAESLGVYGPAASSALPALWQALRDEDSEVRLHASEAIMNIKSGKR